MALAADLVRSLRIQLRGIDDLRWIPRAEHMLRTGAVATLASDVDELSVPVTVKVEERGVVVVVEDGQVTLEVPTPLRILGDASHSRGVTTQAVLVVALAYRHDVCRRRGCAEERLVVGVVPGLRGVRRPLMALGLVLEERREDPRVSGGRVAHGYADCEDLRPLARVGPPPLLRVDDGQIERPDGDRVDAVLHAELRRVGLVGIEGRGDLVEVEALDEVVDPVLVGVGQDTLSFHERPLRHRPDDGGCMESVAPARIFLVTGQADLGPDIDASRLLLYGVVAGQNGGETRRPGGLDSADTLHHMARRELWLTGGRRRDGQARCHGTGDPETLVHLPAPFRSPVTDFT